MFKPVFPLQNFVMTSSTFLQEHVYQFEKGQLDTNNKSFVFPNFRENREFFLNQARKARSDLDPVTVI